MPSQSLDLDRISRLTSVFATKSWLATSVDQQHMVKTFDRICKLSARLNDEQFALFVMLLEDYAWIDYDYYVPGMASALAKMTPAQSREHIYRVGPLLKPKDYEKNKSGTHLVYMFTHIVWKRSLLFNGFKLDNYISLGKLKSAKKPRGPHTTIIIDDFIGSGGTAKDFLDDYEATSKTANETLAFISIGAMAQGVNYIIGRGYNIFYDKLFLKGIEHSSKIVDKPAAYQLMEKIEDLIAISSDYRCGYEKSEALVSMIRTPNNTFPIFWASKCVDGTDWPAPFPR